MLGAFADATQFQFIRLEEMGIGAQKIGELPCDQIVKQKLLGGLQRYQMLFGKQKEQPEVEECKMFLSELLKHLP